MHPRARRNLMLETSAVVEIHDLRFAYHSPTKSEAPVLERRGEHEAGLSSFDGIFFEDGRFKAWYCAHASSSHGEWPAEGPNIGYAESSDGIHWERPELGIIEFRGSRKNNYTDLPFASFSIMPDVTGEHKYLAVGMMKRDSIPKDRWPFDDFKNGYYTAHSDDGLHWQIHPEPIALGGCDVVSGTYDEIEGRYVIIPKVNTRYQGLLLRTMCWTDAKEFGRWGPIHPVIQPGEEDFLEARRHGAVGMDFQQMTILPYKDITLGFVSCFYLDPTYHPAGACTHGRNNVQLVWQEKRLRQGGHHPLYPDCHEYDPRVEDPSPYGARWRFLPGRPAFLQWGSERGVAADVYPAPMIEVGEEMWMYYNATTRWHGETEQKGAYEFIEGAVDFYKEFGLTATWRATMPRDRFVSLWANVRGMVEVRHGSRDGEQLFVNAKCPRGCIRAELVDQDAYQPLPGFDVGNCIGFTGDAVKGELRWKGQEVADIPVDTNLTIRFHVETGDLFAYEFGEA